MNNVFKWIKVIGVSAWIYSMACVQAQEVDANSPIQANLDSLWMQRPIEKVYVQMDKERYVQGETLWFKVYLLDGKDLGPSYLSTLVYVECWSPDDTLVARKTIKVEGGIGKGDLSLPKELSAGVYHIQAYSQWMRNESQHFQASIQVLDPSSSTEPPLLASGKPDVQFLPESGSLLAGGENRVAFKALGVDGWGIPINGKVWDASGNEIQSFESSHRGMGSFAFVPEVGNAYQAEITWMGTTYRYDLPKVEEKGYVMGVNSSPFLTQVQIRSHGLPSDAVVQLVGIMGHRLRISLKARLQEGQAQLDIPNSFFDTGVLQLSLLDVNDQAQCERMIWIDKRDQMDIQVSPQQPVYSKRSLVEVEFQAKSQMGVALSSQLAVSVYEESGMWEGSPYRNSLRSQMLLSSEAKGTIEAPWEYFHTEGASEYLDLVMLTHFWRKVNWDNLGTTLEAPKYLIERGLYISGQVMRNNNKSLPNTNVTLMMGNMFELRETQSDKEGYFAFNDLGFTDTTQLMLQAKTSRNAPRPAKFKLNERSYESAPELPVAALPPFEDLAYIQSSLQQQANLEAIEGIAQYDIEGVEITSKKKDPIVEERGTQLYRTPSMRVDMSKQTYRINVIEAMKGKVPGVSISGQPGSYSIRIRGSSSLTLSNDPLILVDGVPTDIVYAEALPMPLVDYVDVVKGPQAAIFGEQGVNGVIAIYTKQGADALPKESDESRGIYRPTMSGISVSRTFYTPNYATSDTRQDLPDLRSTLVWEPNVQTLEDGTFSLQFYTGDIPGKYRIVVEGISVEGTMGYGSGWIEVE